MTKGLAGVSVAALLAAVAWNTPAFAQSEVKIGLIQPLSGPWARSGEMSRRGAELAVEDINKAGGVRACGGAKVKLVVVDAGDSPEKAKNAAQRLVAQDPDVAGGIGSNISSFSTVSRSRGRTAGVPRRNGASPPGMTSGPGSPGAMDVICPS
jgi:branched-chain amino acid transport system substrate-binding protein